MEFGDFENENGYKNLGADISGIVHRVGAAVKSLRAGDLVAGELRVFLCATILNFHKL